MPSSVVGDVGGGSARAITTERSASTSMDRRVIMRSLRLLSYRISRRTYASTRIAGRIRKAGLNLSILPGIAYSPPLEHRTSVASVFCASPSSTVSAATTKPCGRSLHFPATTSAAAALSRAMSRRGPFSPAKISRRVSADASTLSICKSLSLRVRQAQRLGIEHPRLYVPMMQFADARRAER